MEEKIRLFLESQKPVIDSEDKRINEIIDSIEGDSAEWLDRTLKDLVSYKLDKGVQLAACFINRLYCWGISASEAYKIIMIYWRDSRKEVYK